MAVITSLEFDDFIAARKTAGDAQGAHGGFRAGIDHAQLFDRGIDALDEAGNFRFEQGRRAIARAAGRRFLQGLDDAGMGVAGDHGTPRTDVIDIGVAVDIGDGRSFGRGDKWRCAADASVRTDGAVDATGHEGLGVLKCSLGMSQCEHGYILLDRLQFEEIGKRADRFFFFIGPGRADGLHHGIAQEFAYDHVGHIFDDAVLFVCQAR